MLPATSSGGTASRISRVATIRVAPVSKEKKIVLQSERAVIFRFGKVKGGGAVGPGVFFILPCIDKYRKVDLCTFSGKIMPKEILTKDHGLVSAYAVIYYRISDAKTVILNKLDDIKCNRLVQQLASATLSNAFEKKTLSELLSQRELIAAEMAVELNKATERWGIKVDRFDIEKIRLPREVQKAMAEEAAHEAKSREMMAANGDQPLSLALPPPDGAKSKAVPIATNTQQIAVQMPDELISEMSMRNTTIEKDDSTEWTEERH